MNKMVKRLLAVLAVIGITVGVIGIPQKNEAAYNFSYPASTVYVELVNKQGNDFTKQLTMDASFLSFNYHLNYTSVPVRSPLTITKMSGKNIFAFKIPAFNETATYMTNFTFVFRLLSDVKITTPATTVTSIDVYSGQYTWDRFSQKNNAWWPGQETFSTADLYPTRNGDGTWNFYLHGRSIPNRPGEHASWFGGRNVSEIGVGDGSFVGYGKDGESIKIRLNTPQIEEMFEDEGGLTIPSPSGYANSKYTDVYEQPQSYKMANDSSLPKNYADSNFYYSYRGWYRGAGNKGSMVTTYPPTIGFNATLVDSQNEVHIVYNKRAVRIIDEEYIDGNSTMIDPVWNNMGQSKADGDTFVQVPNATKVDSSGTTWEYQGWKLDSEPMSSMRPKNTPVSVLIDANKTIQYVYRKQQHTITEKWVDQADGSTLVPMAVNQKTSTMDDNDNFTGTASATVTDTGGDVWDYVGWENVTDAPGMVNPSATSAVNNVKGSKEIRYHYKARNTTATLDLKPTPQVTDSGGTVNWSSRLTNTGSSALNNLKLKATSNWAAGLSTPTKVTVTPAGGAPQDFTISPSDWVSGFNLTGINIPSGGPNNYADITFTDTATGAVNQVLPAEIEVTGNMASPITAENFVRIDDPDEPNLEPSGNAGLINIPNFKFGEVEVKPFAQKKTLDAASYQSGYLPYVRFMDNESNFGWDLTVKLGQFTSGSKTLPATTTITLRNGILMDVKNYNKFNESFGLVKNEGTKVIPADGATTVQLTDHTDRGVYHLEYALNNVELDLMAHSGIAGLSYTADMDWTLTTAP